MHMRCGVAAAAVVVAGLWGNVSVQGAHFIRGDVNDDGQIDVADGVAVLMQLFAGEPITCPDALDVNDDGMMDISDAIYLFQYLFAGGPMIPPPSPTCGPDPTPDGLAECAPRDQCPLPDIRIDSPCTDDPDAERRWAVSNHETFQVSVAWRIRDTAQHGELTLLPGVITEFVTVAEADNELVISYAGSDVASFQSPGEVCSLLPSAIPPSAAFSVDTTSGPWPLTVHFADTSIEGSVPIQRWQWDLGDGNRKLEQHPRHVYRTPGVYSVSLTVSNDAGEDIYVATNLITVLDAPDSDGDGIPDWLEEQLGTDPQQWDTSGDGLSDGVLYAMGMNPRDSHGEPVPEAVFLESHPELRLLEVHADRLVFELPETKTDLFEPGNILVSASFEYEYLDTKGFWAKGTGFLRRVAEVIVDGVTVIVVTVDEAIQAVWLELELGGCIGVTLDSAETSLHEYLNDYELYQAGAGAISLTVTTKNGRILLTPAVCYSLLIQEGKVKEFSVRLSGDMLLQQAVEVTASGKYTLDSDIPLVSVPFPVPSTPLLLTLSASIGLDLTFEGQASVHAGFRSNTPIEVGGMYKDGEFTSDSKLTMDREFLGPELDVRASVVAAVYLKPKIDISLYGRAGAYAQLRPFLEFNAQYPCPPESKLDAGIAGEVGVYADLFLWDWTPEPWTLVEFRRRVWTGSCADLVSDPAQAAMPTIAPYQNTGRLSYSVSLSSSTPGATIRFTTNGAEPTERSPRYTAPFLLGGPEGTRGTVKAKAWKSDLAPSHTATRSYVFGTGPGADITITLPGSVPLEMAWCPPGTFLRGRYPREQDSWLDEDPQHQVTLTKGFYLGKYEVTKRQWEAVMGTRPWAGRDFVLNHPDSPAVFVSWDDAQAFITAVNALGQGTFRLPTEAQWEYACRAGTTTRFYWGDDPSYTQIEAYAWHRGNTSDVRKRYAHIVGQKLPSVWGLYDMSGNVWEWCADWYGGYPAGPVTDPTGPTTGSYLVCRGGSWIVIPRFCRSAYRYGDDPGFRFFDLGFRLARD